MRLEEIPMRVSTTSDERDFEMDEETDYLLHRPPGVTNSNNVRIVMVNDNNNRKIRKKRKFTNCCYNFFSHVLCGYVYRHNFSFLYYSRL